ncbi:hypothetical protein M2429_000223 [Enterobacter sp. A4]
MQLHQKRPIKRVGEAGIALRARRGDGIYFCASVRVVVARCNVKSVKVMSGRLRRVCGVWFALRVCRPEAAFWAGLVGLDAVILKADHLHS